MLRVACLGGSVPIRIRNHFTGSAHCYHGSGPNEAAQQYCSSICVPHFLQPVCQQNCLCNPSPSKSQFVSTTACQLDNFCNKKTCPWDDITDPRSAATTGSFNQSLQLSEKIFFILMSKCWPTDLLLILIYTCNIH